MTSCDCDAQEQLYETVTHVREHAQADGHLNPPPDVHLILDTRVYTVSRDRPDTYSCISGIDTCVCTHTCTKFNLVSSDVNLAYMSPNLSDALVPRTA